MKNVFFILLGVLLGFGGPAWGTNAPVGPADASRLNDAARPVQTWAQAADATENAAENSRQAEETPTSAQGIELEIPNLDASVEELFQEANEVVRVVVLPTRDKDSARAEAVTRQIVRTIVDRGREEVVTPALVRATLDAAATQMEAGVAVEAMREMSADHVCFSEVVDAGGEVNLKLRLVEVETGTIRGEKTTSIATATSEQTSLRAADGRARLRRMADELMWGIQQLPGEIRYQRIAVLPLEAKAEAVKNAKVDQFIRAEMSEQLAARGFLIVERNELEKTIEQMSLGATLGEENAPEVGRMLDSQALILGGVGVAGDVFTVSMRAVSTQTGQVLSSYSAEIPRDNVVVLAADAIELRTPEEALFRSLVVPGWGQFYNQESTKGLIFSGLFYGGLLGAAGAGGLGFAFEQQYRGYRPKAGTNPQDATAEVSALREQANGFYSAGIAALSVSALVWTVSSLDAYFSGYPEP